MHLITSFRKLISPLQQNSCFDRNPFISITSLVKTGNMLSITNPSLTPSYPSQYLRNEFLKGTDPILLSTIEINNLYLCVSHVLVPRHRVVWMRDLINPNLGPETNPVTQLLLFGTSMLPSVYNFFF